MPRIITALLLLPALGACAPDFDVRAPQAPAVVFKAARLKIHDGADTPAYPMAGPFAEWFPAERRAARRLHEAIVRDLQRKIHNVGGAGTLVIDLAYVDVSIHKTVVDYPPFITPADDPAPHAVDATVLGSLALEDGHGKTRQTAPLDIHEEVTRPLNGDRAVREAVDKACRLALTDLYGALDRFGTGRRD